MRFSTAAYRWQHFWMRGKQGKEDKDDSEREREAFKHWNPSAQFSPPTAHHPLFFTGVGGAGVSVRLQPSRLKSDSKTINCSSEPPRCSSLAQVLHHRYIDREANSGSSSPARAEEKRSLSAIDPHCSVPLSLSHPRVVVRKNGSWWMARTVPRTYPYRSRNFHSRTENMEARKSKRCRGYDSEAGLQSFRTCTRIGSVGSIMREKETKVADSIHTIREG